MQPRVIVGTNHGLYELGERQELRLEGHRVSALVRQGGSQWAVIDDTAIWRATDGGEWQQVADSGSQRVNCILPQEGCALVGTADAHLFILRNGELSRIHAFDEAPGRDTWTTPSGAPPDTRSLAIDADGVIYANVHVGGVVRTADVDGAWEPTIDVDADVHEIVFDASSGSLFAASAIGLASSDDGGGTWSFYTEGLHGIYQRAVAVAGEAILVTASTRPTFLTELPFSASPYGRQNHSPNARMVCLSGFHLTSTRSACPLRVTPPPSGHLREKFTCPLIKA